MPLSTARPLARPATLADVAAAAGVHASTVSRTLSRPELVKTATLDRVAAAVDRLGYVPNRAARQLAGGAAATVAMLVPDITNPFFSMVVQAAQRRASQSEMLVLLADTTRDPATELEAVRSLAPNVDGMIACSPVAPTRELRSAAGGRPLIFVNRRARGVVSISVDQPRVVTMAVDHLRRLGHRRIAVAQGPAGYWSSVQRARQLKRLGPGLIPLPPTAPTFDAGRAIIDAVVVTTATAVVAFNDVMALGLISGAIDRGIGVPEDLSVVGADGVPAGTMVTPALTTVAVDLEALGEGAVHQLARLCRGERPGQTTIAPQLVVRRSTGSPGGTRTQ